MPKLDDETAQAVAEAESSGGIMEEGIQESVLLEVTVHDGKEHPYWKWTFQNPAENADGTPHPYKNWKHWHITSLSPAASFKLNEAFEAFGVPSDTDTDELIGQRVRIVVGTRTVQAGKREGELANTVENLLPLEVGKVSSGETSTIYTSDDPWQEGGAGIEHSDDGGTAKTATKKASSKTKTKEPDLF